MVRFFRFSSVALLPFFTLLLGWQLGIRYAAHQFELQQDHLNALFTVGGGSGRTVVRDPEGEVDISLLWSVWRLLLQHYISPDDLNARAMVYGAVSGMVSAVADPYTVFMTPSDTKNFQDVLQGNLEGIGAQLEHRQNETLIVAPLKGSPAEHAGLKPHDVIVKVDETDVTSMSLEEIVRIVRGPQGTSVTLTVFRPSIKDTLTVTLVREHIHVPSVESRIIQTPSGPLAYVALNQFGDESTTELMKALASFDQKKVRGLILDLRFNGGGLLEGAVDLVSMFVEQGKVVTVEQRGQSPEVHYVHGNAVVPTLPMVVLINEGSASASEITAGALQDLHRATIVGMQSFGKGTVQQIIDLPGGSALRVTIARWLTPNGHSISKKGIVPDIIVDRSLQDYKDEKDPQLEAAQVWLLDHRKVSEKVTHSSSR